MHRKNMTAVYSVSHFFVDLACAFLIFRYIAYSDNVLQLVLLYNFCAFALQMPIGILADRFGRGHAIAAIGCGIIAAAYLTALLNAPLVSVLAAGIGNAMFHIGGGVYVLDEYDDCGALGVFVSPGAVGLYLGTVLGRESISSLIPVLPLLFCAVSIVMVSKLLSPEDRWGRSSYNIALSIDCRKLILPALLFFAVVCIRSFGGFAMSFEWKSGFVPGLMAVLATAGGKAAGGFFSDRLGMLLASIISMAAAALLFILSANIISGLLALFFFNMSMPITLRAAKELFNDRRGFSFGLLTFALFIGYIPFCIGNERPESEPVQMSVLCVISAVLLCLGLRFSKIKVKKYD